MWETLDIGFTRPEKYITDALDPIIKFIKYNTFDHGAICKFYSLVRSATLGVRGSGLWRDMLTKPKTKQPLIGSEKCIPGVNPSRIQ